MQIEMTDTKGLVVKKDGDSQILTQGQITRTIKVLSATVTLADGTETDTTIDIPEGALCLGFKIERLVDGATNVDITSIGTNNAGGTPDAVGAFTLANEANATSVIAKACPAASRDTPVGAINLFVTHGDVNAGGAQIRVSVMIEQFS